jgi:hypothetical protein
MEVEMSEKTHEDMVEEFLANGGKIEVLESVEVEQKNTISSTQNKVPELKTLAEAEFLYGKTQKKKRKKKQPDFSNINKELIPDNLKHILNKVSNNANLENTKEKENETN